MLSKVRANIRREEILGRSRQVGVHCEVILLAGDVDGGEMRYQQPTLEPQVLELFSVVNESLLDAHETRTFSVSNFGLMTPVQFLYKVVETYSKYRSIRVHASHIHNTKMLSAYSHNGRKQVHVQLQ